MKETCEQRTDKQPTIEDLMLTIEDLMLTIEDLSPKDAVSVESLKGVGRLRHHDIGSVRAEWAVFDPKKLIETLERYHEDEAVAFAITKKEMRAGVDCPTLFMGNVLDDNTDLSVLTGLVGGEDSSTLEEWRKTRGEDSE